MTYQDWSIMNNLDRLDNLINKMEILVEDIEKLITMQKEIDKKILKLKKEIDKNE